MSRLKDLYMDEIREQMMKKFGYKNIMQVPKLDKIVVNMGEREDPRCSHQRYGYHHRPEARYHKS